MINLENMYAVIPDIHGDFAHLETTVLGLGFKKSCSDASWRHPKGRKAVFLGNFIDGGKDNEQVIETVRAMVEAGAAQAIMGNHEFNALLFHERHPTEGGYQRAHNNKNFKQHQSFLDEFGLLTEHRPSSSEYKRLEKVLNWFEALPLYLEMPGGLALVHAQWDAACVAYLSKQGAKLLPLGTKGEDRVKRLTIAAD